MNDKIVYASENGYAGDIVLDNCMGSGSTGVACVNLNRDFIGMELKQEYFNIAKERIHKAQTELIFDIFPRGVDRRSPVSPFTEISTPPVTRPGTVGIPTM